MLRTYTSLHSSPIEAQQHAHEERQKGRKDKKDAALFRLVAVCEEVAKREEDEADEEVGDPCLCRVSAYH